MKSRDHSRRDEAPDVTSVAASVSPVPAPAPALNGALLSGGNQMIVRLLRSSDPAGSPDNDLADRIRARLGRGEALPANIRSDMESNTGQRFGDVVVHRDAEAASLSRQLGARAFTTGRDVFFGSGAYDPASTAGRATLAHELTHTVQQRAGQVPGTEVSTGLFVSDPHDHDEREADAVARNLTVQRCGDHVEPGCACAEDDDRLAVHRQANGPIHVQRTAEAALEWFGQAAKEGAKVGVGIGLGAAGMLALAAGAVVTLWSNTSIVKDSEEARLHAHATAQQHAQVIAQAIGQLNAMSVITQDVVDKVKGQVDGAIQAVEDDIRRTKGAVMRCSEQMLAFRAIAQRLKDYLNQPLDQINKVELIRLLEEFFKAMDALLACVGVKPPDGGGDQAG